MLLVVYEASDFMTSRWDADSIAEPLATVLVPGLVGFGHPARTLRDVLGSGLSCSADLVGEVRMTLGQPGEKAMNERQELVEHTCLLSLDEAAIARSTAAKLPRDCVPLAATARPESSEVLLHSS